MVEPHIAFVTVQQAGKANDGKRIKLSKSLFRQVLESPPFVKKSEPSSPAVFIAKLGDFWPSALLADTTTCGQIVGFVNYFWPGCLTSLFRMDDCSAGSLLQVWLGKSSSIANYDYAARHVLWLNPNQELRRCYMSQDLLKTLGQQDIPQLFLGSVLFG